MSERQRAELAVEIVRFVSEEPQPGLVECVLVDAGRKLHCFVDKAVIFSAEHLSAASGYPRAGTIACELEAEWRDESGRDVARVDTTRPWSVEALDGTTRFVVLSSQLRR